MTSLADLDPRSKLCNDLYTTSNLMKPGIQDVIRWYEGTAGSGIAEE